MQLFLSIEIAGIKMAHLQIYDRWRKYGKKEFINNCFGDLGIHAFT